MATAEDDRDKSSAAGREFSGGLSASRDISMAGGIINFSSVPLETVAKADPGNIQEVAASQLALSTSYYESVLA
jgi:hypothetical protein